MSCQDKSIGQSELERFRFVDTIVLIEIVLSDMNSVSLKLFQLFRVFLDSKSKVRAGRFLSIDKNFFCAANFNCDVFNNFDGSPYRLLYGPEHLSQQLKFSILPTSLESLFLQAEENFGNVNLIVNSRTKRCQDFDHDVQQLGGSSRSEYSQSEYCCCYSCEVHE